MAKFLNTPGISYYLEELIKATKDRLILISPYLQFNDRIKEHINTLTILKKDIRIIYRDNKLHPDENNWLEKQTGVRTSICKNLHAKCYLNEAEAIITSMNLYEFSQQNNNEMGIYISKAEDPDLYNATYEEASRILTISEEIRITVKKISSTAPHHPEKKKDDLKESGFCIRTGMPIPFNVAKPMSNDAYKLWSKFGNPDYPEKYCHFSGELSNGETSLNKPILKKNWPKAKEIYNL